MGVSFFMAKYSFEFKTHVVELYLSKEVSYQELDLSVGIGNPPLITKWVNDFRISGSDALRPKRKGRKKSLESPKRPHNQKKSLIQNQWIQVLSMLNSLKMSYLS